VRTKKNPEIPMVPKAQLKNVEHQRNQFKTQRDTLIDDIAVLRANNERLERENEKYIKLLKEFKNLINYKLAIHPGSDVYMYYRSELNKLGVK